MAKSVEWIKLTVDMFDNRKIRHLRKLPEGNNIVLIWVMLLTMAGRCNANGMIFLTENIPYTIRMLADELDFEESTIRLALEALERFDMIVMDEDAFYIPGWGDHQNVDGMDRIREQNRIRQQRRRERQALSCKETEEKEEENHSDTDSCAEKAQENTLDSYACYASRDSNVTVTESNATDIRYKNKNKEIDIKKEKDKKEKGRRASVLEYPQCDEKLKNALERFVEYRSKIRKPVTQHALDLLAKKLFAMSNNDSERIKILEQSIMQGWTGIFSLNHSGDSGWQKEERENKWRRFAGNDENDRDGVCENNGQTGKRIWERFASEGSGGV